MLKKKAPVAHEYATGAFSPSYKERITSGSVVYVG